MSTILLAIKPRYVDMILSGKKKIEYRRKVPAQMVDKIIIYASSPIKKVVGEVNVTGTFSMSVSQLWNRTNSFSGITEIEFHKYFTGCKIAHAFILGKSIKYKHHKELSYYGISRAPQSFMYLKI